MVTGSPSHPGVAGRMRADIAADRGSPERAAAARVLPAGTICVQRDEADVRANLADPHTAAAVATIRT
jgi:hypothetical protein